MPTVAALYAPVALPLLAAALSVVLPWRVAAWIGTGAATAILASAVALAAQASQGHAAAWGLLRADALTAYLLLVVGAVATTACWSSVTYLDHETRHGDVQSGAARRYVVLVQIFLASMSLAVLADNLGLLWGAVEATTIVTAFLVGHRRTRASVEAAWKYVVLCSAGIAIAFLGTVFVYAAAVHAGGHGATALNWTYLNAHAAGLDPALTRLAAGLILLGFGTKAGLAPMHWWLPDAHSQAPAPVSALMSGVLLSVAFYAILRYKTVVDQVLGPGYVRVLLLAAALLSLAVAAMLLLSQRDYKRLLAYSSIEHMGLVALGAAIGGPLALAAVLLHVLGHGLAKSVAFCSAGKLQQGLGSSRVDAVRGLAARSPLSAAAFGGALLALLGMPPFSLFASELGIARAGVGRGYGWAVAAAFALVAIAYAAVIRHAGGMLLGARPADDRPVKTPMSRGSTPLVLGLAAAVALGIWLGPLRPLLDAAAHIAGGS